MSQPLKYNEFIKICPKDRPFRARVESNPFGKGGPQDLWIWFNSINNELDTYFPKQMNIDGVDYVFSSVWATKYAGTFQFLEDEPTLPPVDLSKIKIGDKIWVEYEVESIDKDDQNQTFCIIGCDSYSIPWPKDQIKAYFPAQPETVEIEGKKYLKSDIEKLTPIE